jgi:hypothetical protein
MPQQMKVEKNEKKTLFSIGLKEILISRKWHGSLRAIKGSEQRKKSVKHAELT